MANTSAPKSVRRPRKSTSDAEVVATPPAAPPAKVAAKVTTAAKAKPTPTADFAPSHDQIAIRAFEIYCGRGGADGAHVDDWLRAEAELRAELRG